MEKYKEVKTNAMFQFPIRNIRRESLMKNIAHSALPTFHGLASKDPNDFTFYFNFLCFTFDYFSNAKRLKLFLATLKNARL